MLLELPQADRHTQWVTRVRFFKKILSLFLEIHYIIAYLLTGESWRLWSLSFTHLKKKWTEKKMSRKLLLGSAYCFVISGMTSLILWYQLDESFILALRRPAVPLLQPDTVMVSDCCNCSACSSYSSAIQLAPTSWLCHIALMGCLGMDPPPNTED